MNDFLMHEYSQLYDEKRHYDNRSFSFITMYLALLTICISVVSFAFDSLGNNTRYLIIALSGIQVLTGVVVVVSLYYNRVSAVKSYRQINAIRRYCLKTESFPGYINMMKIECDDPNYFKLDSMHFFMAALIICLNSVCAGILGGSAFGSIVCFVLFAILAFISQIIPYVAFLMKRDTKKPTQTNNPPMS